MRELVNAGTLRARVGGGTLFEIRVSSASSRVRTGHGAVFPQDYWPPLGATAVQEASADPERSFTVDLDSTESLLRFESDFGLYVAEKLEGYVAVHSALLVIGEQVVIVPGVSHAGKSTLTHAALEAGHRVLSDEYTLIQSDTGLVRGWPRPIRRRQPDGSITRIPIPRDDGHYEPTHVVDVRYDATIADGSDTGQLHLEPISAGDVAFSLLGNTVCAQSRPEESLRAVAAVSRKVTGFQGTRGEASVALAELESLLRQA